MAIPTYGTIEPSTKFGPVAEMREAIYPVTRNLNVHKHACVGSKEREAFVEQLKNSARRLVETASKRAKESDWLERERCLDSSADFIIKSREWINAAKAREHGSLTTF